MAVSLVHRLTRTLTIPLRTERIFAAASVHSGRVLLAAFAVLIGCARLGFVGREPLFCFDAAECPVRSCSDDVECNAGTTCINSLCYYICANDADCPIGQECTSQGCQPSPGVFCENPAMPCRSGCAGVGLSCLIECGNGRLGAEEECDDGNRVAEDGCSFHCRIEYGYSCVTEPNAPSSCGPRCGDRVIQIDEQCDDGRAPNDGDGCSSACSVEYGFLCLGQPSRCVRADCGTNDADGDFVPDLCDACIGDDRFDADTDGIPDSCDHCPNDNPNDSDGDLVCDGLDRCPGFADGGDLDGDGVVEPSDADSDGVPDACDRCMGGDDSKDADLDTLADACDPFPSEYDVDSDEDGMPDNHDPCPLDHSNDDDGDGVCNSVDECPLGNDNFKYDPDGLPNSCRFCLAGDDSDGDSVPDSCDRCPGHDDHFDPDGDWFPDFPGCDPCPGQFFNDYDRDGICGAEETCSGGWDQIDTDHDGLPNGCDFLPGSPSAVDRDGDTVPDLRDVCSGHDDRLDWDGDGIPAECDPCPLDNPNDSDGDGVCNANDRCPNAPDALDTDRDGVPDGCDQPCTDTGDSDRDGIADCKDRCPSDPWNDIDDDGICGNEDSCDRFSDDESYANFFECWENTFGVPASGNDRIDTDHDGIANGCDRCMSGLDIDGDNRPDDCDRYPGGHDQADLNGDKRVDAWDDDLDGIPNGADRCPLDYYNDIDDDGLCANDDPHPIGEMQVFPGSDAWVGWFETMQFYNVRLRTNDTVGTNVLDVRPGDAITVTYDYTIHNEHYSHFGQFQAAAIGWAITGRSFEHENCIEVRRNFPTTQGYDAIAVLYAPLEPGTYYLTGESWQLSCSEQTLPAMNGATFVGAVRVNLP